MSNLLLIAACLALGAALRALGVLPADAPKALNAVVLYVALPAMVLVKLHGVRLGADALLPASMAWLQFGIVVVLVWAFGAAFGWTRDTRAALLLTAGVGNTSFVGWPLVEALLGPEALPTAIFCDQLGSFVVTSTLGLVVAAWGAGGQATPAQIAARIVRFPAIPALVLALLLRDVALPEALIAVLDRLGGTLTPLALLSVGSQLRLTGGGDDRPLAVGLAIKLLIAPALVLGTYRALGFPLDLPLRTTVVEAAMPPMITGAILAAERGISPALVSRMVGIGIPLGIVTASLWAWALG